MGIGGGAVGSKNGGVPEEIDGFETPNTKPKGEQSIPVRCPWGGGWLPGRCCCHRHRRAWGAHRRPLTAAGIQSQRAVQLALRHHVEIPLAIGGRCHLRRQSSILARVRGFPLLTTTGHDGITGRCCSACGRKSLGTGARDISKKMEVEENGSVNLSPSSPLSFYRWGKCEATIG